MRGSVASVAAALLLVVFAARRCAGWGSGHCMISRAALPLQQPEFRALLGKANTTWLGKVATPGDFLTCAAGGGALAWSESADAVAGPCAANVTTPCSPTAVAAKLEYARFCYAEDAAGAQ
eukprot:gene538-4078_t